MRGTTAIAVGAAVVASLLVWAMAGCGDDSDGAESSDKDEIRAVFEAYQAAAQGGDGEALCEDILAPSQLGSESVEQCAREFDQSLQSRVYQDLPAVELGKITIEGKSATADNATKGGFFEFRHEEGRWWLILIR
jgi:hypothetical protein